MNLIISQSTRSGKDEKAAVIYTFQNLLPHNLAPRNIELAMAHHSPWQHRQTAASQRLRMLFVRGNLFIFFAPTKEKKKKGKMEMNLYLLECTRH